MNRRLLCVGIFVAAALPRLAYLAYARPFFVGEYWELAGNLLEHGQLGFQGGRTTYEPLYPLFLAAARALTGDRVWLVQTLQAVVASAGAIYLFLLAEELTSRRSVALLAGALWAIDPLLIRHAVAPGEFSLMSTLLAAFTYSFVRTTRCARAGGGGPLARTGDSVRTMALPLVALSPAILAGNGRRMAAVVLATTALAVASPLAVRNYSLNGSILPTRSGVNLFIGNSKYSAGLLPDHSPDVLQDYARDVASRHGLAVSEYGIEDERAANALFTRLAIDEWRRHPGPMLRLKVRNVGYFFWLRLIPAYVLTDDTTIALEPDGRFRIENSPLRPPIEDVLHISSYGFLLAAAVVGIHRRGRAIRRDLVMWCIMLTFLAASVIYFPATRYRVPTEFVILFYAAVALDSLITRRPSETGEVAG